jgi:hypothetical protein
MLSLGLVELVFILVILAVVILPIWGIIDAAVRPDGEWQAAGQSKVVWIVVQFFLRRRRVFPCHSAQVGQRAARAPLDRDVDVEQDEGPRQDRERGAEDAVQRVDVVEEVVVGRNDHAHHDPDDGSQRQTAAQHTTAIANLAAQQSDRG